MNKPSCENVTERSGQKRENTGGREEFEGREKGSKEEGGEKKKRKKGRFPVL